MGQKDATHGVLDTAAAAFLARRLHHQRMRAAAVREREGHAASPHSTAEEDVPPLSIVVMTVGSRGDVQPFIPIGRRLAKRHRVRIATHEVFRSLVEGAGLEFYPLAGDPTVLMDYMLRSGGRILNPRRPDLVLVDAPRQRTLIAEILASTWRACTEPDPDRPAARPFKADLIIANPPSFGHIHCAQALGVPLHMVFTMPWSPTTVYPHPFAGLDSGQNQPLQNYLSYGAADLVIWTGIHDLVNGFRGGLGLPPLSLVEGAGMLDDHAVPFTYLWPEALVPRPTDWPPHIEVANFTFYALGHDYQPPAALADFLAGGEAPIYVGFGSVLVDDPAAVAHTIFSALEKAGARGVVSEGWAHLRGGTPPPNVFMLGDTPHDWLFPRCRAVCHHGGAGTTSAGLRAGLPTVVVPSFGDQFFWGRVVADAGAGPDPIPITRLKTAALTAAFDACRRPQVRERAQALGARLREIDGAELVVQSVYRWLPVERMRCATHRDRLATIECLACGDRRLCPECVLVHAADLKRPCRYVDWDVSGDLGLVAEVGDLVGDAAKALRAGFDELVSKLASRSS